MDRGLFELVDRMIGVDASGRLSASGPHVYVFRTTDDVVCRFHVDLPDDVARSLEQIARTDRGRQRDWPREYGRYLALLASVGTVQAVRAGMLYRLVDPPQSEATRITRANADLLRGGMEEWLPDAEAGRLIFAGVADGRAVSICASVSAVAGAHAAGVETLPAYRRRGFAAQAVAGWGRAVLETDAAPFYGTTFDNLASQRVAGRLGMELVGSEFSVRCAFGEAV
jgi:hypothetical protein